MRKELLRVYHFINGCLLTFRGECESKHCKMSLLFISVHFCAIIFALQNVSVNSESSTPFFKYSVSDYFSELYNSVPTIQKIKTTCIENVKSFSSGVGDKFSTLVSKFHSVVYEPDGFFTRDKLSTLVSKFHGVVYESDVFQITRFWWSEKPPRVNFCATAFEHLIRRELIGQHIAHFTVSDLLKKHLTADNPRKPLVMSFQGPVGTGKSFLSSLIAESLFEDGFNSKYVHFYYGGFFSNEKDKVQYYRKLQFDIPFYLSLCSQSLFIFDDIDNMVPGVLDALVPFIFLDTNSNQKNFTKSIYIFISNSGSGKIEQKMLNGWFEGIPRESFMEKDFTTYLKSAAYNESGGLQQSDMIERNLIDAFVPFLPLERDHVKQCIRKELKFHNLLFNEYDVEKVAKQLQYYPLDLELFSKSGCKRVRNKVDLFF